ncbi:MAG: 3-ketoacyl-ACP reductase [Rhizobiaceae bacterium]
MKPVALITGGQQGIGLGIAQALATAGFRLAVVAEKPADDQSVVEALASLPQDTLYQCHDICDVESHGDLLDKLEQEYGPIDCLISNAGISSVERGDMLEVVPENLDAIYDVNLRGGYFLAQQVARRMLDSPGSHYRSLVFVTSVSADIVSIERSEYCISKAAASMMAKLYAARLAPHDIGVFELRPGIIDTAMTSPVKEKYTPEIEGGLVPAGRWGQPADIGTVVVPLVTGKMAFSTGMAVPIDGGLSIQRL